MRSDVVPGAAFPDYELHIVGAVRGTAVGGHGESVALRCDDTLDAWRVMLLPDEVRFEEGQQKATSGVAGTASEVWLFMTGRPAPSIHLLGDATVVTHLQNIIRSVGI